MPTDGKHEGTTRAALVVGCSAMLTWALPFLLSRAGFAVDMIATPAILRASRFVRRFEHAASSEMLARRARDRVETQPYDWVIAADDDALTALAAIAWREDARPRHLPVWRDICLRHLGSKIGLSRVLSAGGIRTPAFAVAHDCREAIAAARDLGYPVMLKIDRSSGGTGVFACEDDAQIQSQASLFARGPLLVQKRIAGRELDLSAVFFDGVLVHFTYAAYERTQSPLGPSVVRLYHPTAGVPSAIFDELTVLGRVLGAGGFVNISCIDADDGSGRQYFEADMRPTVWVDHSRFYGEDLAPRLRDWFDRGVGLACGGWDAESVPAPVVLPYFLRMRVFELLVNRYRVWDYMAWEDAGLVRRLLLRRLLGPLLSPAWRVVRAARRAR